MFHDKTDLLDIAVRAYPQAPEVGSTATRRRPPWRAPKAMFVFDTETRVDATQRLTFGSYRFIVSGVCMEEGLFYADDLSAEERQLLEEYAATHAADVVPEGTPELRLLSRREFLDRLYRAVYKGRCLLVGFNLPFDLSRVAFDCTAARGRFAGGFSLGLWTYGEPGNERRNQYRPRICMKQIDSKRALKGFTACNSPDASDLIPEESESGQPESGYKFRGHLLDLRTLAFALTDKGYSLQSACRAFAVEHGKLIAPAHGQITASYIDYNRRDVLATSELAERLLEEYARHPITLQPTKAYSPASVGKAYLRAMGITPILERQPDFLKKYLGYAQSAFFGGRTSAHIRKVAVPVVYTDFLSMYPTVNSLMDLWPFVIAREVRVVEHCKQEVVTFLENVTADKLFQRSTWRRLTAFVKLIPNGDILPSRSKYSAASNDWQVAVNHLHADPSDASKALWFSLPDVVASVILTGRIPEIVDAFRIEHVGTLPELKPVRLRGAIEVHPEKEDFFRVVIQERKQVGTRTDISGPERERLNKALKVLANSTSYGIYAEMNRQESDDQVNVICHGIDDTSFTCRVAHPDVPGEFCFPPLASLITGGARLMLALLEASVSGLGGSYAMEDTDSMAIVATEFGGTIPCAGGPEHLTDGQRGTKALSWAQVTSIVERFGALNPYDRSAVPGSILKMEDDNFDPETGAQRQIHCFAISAKRYALFLKDRRGRPMLLRKGVNNGNDRWSEHGLGHLLNPTDPNSDDREWIAQIWANMISRALKFKTPTLSFQDAPAVGRVSVSSPAVLKPLAGLNQGKRYSAQVKPFNFLLTCHVSPMGHPAGADPARFHLIAPYESNGRKWLGMEWIDQYTGKKYHITTARSHGRLNTARVKTYGEVAREYEFHPESKCADVDGNTCERQTVGLLQRRHLEIDLVKYIGKESNRLEEVDAGLIHSEEGVYTEYPDGSRDEWNSKMLPALRKLPLSLLIAQSGLSRRAVLDIRAGRSRPHPKNQEKLATVLRSAFERSPAASVESQRDVESTVSNSGTSS